jgi:hypothetical protein
MPSDWLTTNALPITAGWGGPPQLSAPSIGGLVGDILRDRLAREKMTQENIAEAIKNIREERQSNAYLDQMKAAGLIPEDYAAGGLGGAKLGTTLAAAIRQQKEDALRAQYHAARLSGRGRGGGGGGGAGGGGAAGGGEGDETLDIPETYTDEQGREWRRTTTGGWTLIPKYGQPSITPQQTAQEEAVRPAYQAAQEAQTEAERRKKILEERFGAPQEGVLPATGFGEERKAKAQTKYLRRLTEEEAAKKKQAELEKKYPGLTAPTPRPDAYASPDEIRRARARQALDDPEATEEEKRQAAIILSQ